MQARRGFGRRQEEISAWIQTPAQLLYNLNPFFRLKINQYILTKDNILAPPSIRRDGQGIAIRVVQIEMRKLNP